QTRQYNPHPSLLQTLPSISPQHVQNFPPTSKIARPIFPQIPLNIYREAKSRPLFTFSESLTTGHWSPIHSSLVTRHSSLVTRHSSSYVLPITKHNPWTVGFYPKEVQSLHPSAHTYHTTHPGG